MPNMFFYSANITHRNNNNWTHFKFGMSRFCVPYFIILKKNNTAAIICSNSASEQCFTNSKLWQNFQMWERKLVSIHKRLCAIFGRCAVNRSLIAELRELLLSGETKLHDLPYSESLPTATNPDYTPTAQRSFFTWTVKPQVNNWHWGFQKAR